MKIKTINALTKELCKREAGKKQVDIAQMKETVGHLADIFYEISLSGWRLYDVQELTCLLQTHGEKRAAKKLKSKK